MNRREISFLWAHKRLSLRRTPGKSGVVKVFMGIFYAMLLLELLAFGVASKSIITKIYPEKDPVTAVNSLLLYWFLIEVSIRYVIQSLPVMDIVPYLHLPVRKSSLIGFLQLKGFSHPANYLSLLLFIPFSISASAHFSSIPALLIWLFTLLASIWLATICALHIKRREVIKPSSSYLFLLILVGLSVADYYGWPTAFSLRDLSGYLFNAVNKYPFLSVIPLILAIFVGWVNFRFMEQHIYLDEAIQKKQDKVEMRGSFLSKNFGLTGALIDLDLKLTWRSKRTRSQIYMIGIFLFYGLFIYNTHSYSNNLFVLCLVGIYNSGIPMLMFGQMPFDSVYFEGTMSRVRLFDYIKARYTLFATLTIISCLLTLPYLFFGREVLKINLICFLYNIGISPFLLLRLAASNRKRVDISQSSSMNMQGVTFTQIVVVMVMLFIPGTIAAIFRSIWPVALLGIVGIITIKWQLKWVVNSFMKQKHAMIEGFRKK